MRSLFARLFEAAVLALAALAFFKVPLGSKTLFEHAAAVLRTEPAKEAGRAIEGAILELRKSALGLHLPGPGERAE